MEALCTLAIVTLLALLLLGAILLVAAAAAAARAPRDIGTQTRQMTRDATAEMEQLSNTFLHDVQTLFDGGSHHGKKN